jgi:hypothetical protein
LTPEKVCVQTNPHAVSVVERTSPMPTQVRITALMRTSRSVHNAG